MWILYKSLWKSLTNSKLCLSPYSLVPCWKSDFVNNFKYWKTHYQKYLWFKKIIFVVFHILTPDFNQ